MPILGFLAKGMGLRTLGVSGLTQGMLIEYLEGYFGYDILEYSVLTFLMFVTRCCA